MAAEMLSGPDRGGGFLFQLTRSGSGAETRYTVHAQDGAEDAGGPPIGPLDSFGFVRPDQYCDFGGRFCWHRTFEMPIEAALAVRTPYNRLRFVVGPMLEQAYREKPVALETGLGELVDRVAPALAHTGLPWAVGGSTAAWLRGADLTPHDIDLAVTKEGVELIGREIPEYLIEPPAWTEWPGKGRVFGLRAFVGTLVAGVRVEAATSGSPPKSRSDGEWSLDEGGPSHKVLWKDREVPVTRAEFAMVRVARRGVLDPDSSFGRAVRSEGVSAEFLRSLLEASKLTDQARKSVERFLFD